MKTLTTLITSVAFLALAAPAMASTVSGTLSTGVSTGISGIVDAGVSASVPPGTYASTQSVALSASGSDNIYYTVDGSSPACAPTTGTLYAGAITVSSSETIRAAACFGTVASPVGVFAYGINIPTPSSSGGGSSGGGGGGGGSSGGGSVITTPTTATTTLVGDINGDGQVNVLDFNTLLVQWGETGSNLSADLNHDGVVDVLDFNLLMAHWTA
ncbi:MAG: hypothetical protein B7X04_02265 [Parcubacteria group bacterium 21-54-25]|nr:MAG: hypothetical protein B7X04_02265 [Parcubacteria group bacterium 21-54-25]HQU07872.1 chitobiase/beta-hexosaminidase C-terminal domain-containing protein [Candidatus Paceibacterota bacterium]